MTLARLVVLRHGETDWNAQQRMQGHRDIALNATGARQAAAVAPSIAALAPDVVVSSDLQRARETAEIVAAPLGLAVHTDARLRETSLGEWEGLVRDEVRAQWPDMWDRWRHRGAHESPPGGESRLAVSQRALAVIDEWDATEASTALLVTHGGLIVGLTGRLLGIGHELWGSLVGVGNCHWVELVRIADRWKLHTYNGGLGTVVWPEDADSAPDD